MFHAKFQAFQSLKIKQIQNENGVRISVFVYEKAAWYKMLRAISFELVQG